MEQRDIGDLNGNGMYDIEDFLMFENKQFIDMANNGKKFDVVLMNPPYGIEGDSILHLRFIEKSLDLCNNIVAVFPFSFAIRPASLQLKKYKQLCNERLIEVEEISGDVFDGTNMSSNVGIYTFKEFNDNRIIIKDINNNEFIANDLSNPPRFTKYEMEIMKYLDNHGNIDIVGGGYHNHCTLNSLRKKGITDEEKAWKIIDKDIENNLKKVKDGKVILTLNASNFGSPKFIGPSSGKIFFNKKSVVEFMKEHGRKSSTGAIFFHLDSEKAAKNARIALQNHLLRFQLYRTLYNNGISIPYNCRYIPNIDWEDDRTQTDEGILEMCGCPTEKVKEYADYCKDIIDRVDNGERP